MVALAVTGCYASDAHLHAYCCLMCQSLGLLLVALHNVRSLKKLKLDFTAFSWAQPSADALMALECLWRQMRDLLTVNGHIRFDASFVSHQPLASLPAAFTKVLSAYIMLNVNADTTMNPTCMMSPFGLCHVEGC